MRSSSSSGIASVGVMVLALALPESAPGNTGGGSGKPVQTYHSTPTAIEVAKRRSEYNENVRISWDEVDRHPFMSDALNNLCRVRLGYMSSDGRVAAAKPEIVGREKGQDADSSIALADLDSVALEGVKNDVVDLSLELIPGMTPEALVELKPTYTAILTQARRVRFEVAATVRNRGELVLVGTSCAKKEATVFVPLLPIKQLTKGQALSLRAAASNRWWAIESVISDPAYPDRLVFKK